MEKKLIHADEWQNMSFKELLEEFYGHNISAQEAFNAQDDLAALLLVLDEIDRELFPPDVPSKPNEDENPQGGIQ